MDDKGCAAVDEARLLPGATYAGRFRHGQGNAYFTSPENVGQ